MSDTNIIDSAIIKYYSNNMNAFDNDDALSIINKIQLNHLLYNDVLNRINKIKEYRKQLFNLKQIPFVKQRTPEWLDLRKDRLTASDLYDAVKGGANTIMALAKKKANVTVDKINYKNIPPLKWGTMFEPMAARCYSQCNKNIMIHDFGLICDTRNQHFGASPDGISDMGIMIEIKCPYTRKLIDGFIPPKYLLQIQGQLAVCQLEECDYIECEFKCFESQEEYFNTLNSDITQNHGIIAECFDRNGEYYYLYSDENVTPKKAFDNISIQVSNMDSNLYTMNKYIYWQLIHMNIQKVKFNADEWKSTSEKITAFWNKVEDIKKMSVDELKLLETPKKKIKFVDDNE
jgi:putative phage-type endonuclease